MIANHPPALNLQDLKNFIYQTLCEHEKLEIGVFPMTERLLTRRTRPCGILFCLHGPRSVKFTAIWETDRNTVLFYGATGERFHTLRLAKAPLLEATESST